MMEMLAHMSDCPEKVQIGVECVEATLHLFEERFKLLVRTGTP